jgi:hypothetical protein
MCELTARPTHPTRLPRPIQVAEAEPPAPAPDHVLLMLQVNPAVTDAATMEGELQVCVAGGPGG